MSWLFYALLATLGKSIQNFVEKKSQKKIGSFLTFFLLMLISTIFYLPFVFFIPFPKVNFNFWVGVLGSVFVYLIAKPFRLFALGIGDLSEIVPLVSFSSLFSLIYGWIFLEEVPTSWGLFGVALITIGGYLMNFDNTQSGIFNKLTHPFKSILKTRHQSYLFLSLILIPISGIFDKFAIKNTFPRSPFYTLFLEAIILTALLIPILRVRKIKLDSLKSFNDWKLPLLLGVVYALDSFLSFSAINIGYVGYVSAVKQLQSLVAVLVGYFILKEGNLKKRMVSAIVMGTGVFLIAYLG